MKALRVVFRLGLLIALGLEIPGLPATAQTTPPKEAQPLAAGLRRFSGDDAKRAEKLDKAIDAVLKADRWDQAIARAEELLGLRTRVQGPKHFETVTEEWRLKAFRRVAAMPHEDRVAYQSAQTLYEQAETLFAQGKHAEAHPLFQKALEINRRLLTDEHPYTAACYNKLASNLNAQRKYAQARDRWLRAVKSLDAARLRIAFTGLERADGSKESVRPALAAVLARLGQPAEAWQPLEEDLGRGLLDELAARQDRRLSPAERARLRELTAALERLDRLVETRPKDLDQAQGPRPGRAGQAVRGTAPSARAGQHRPG
ncbi:MAG: tetratricopeptide repeat protein [Isosphaerales bacterium]